MMTQGVKEKEKQTPATNKQVISAAKVQHVNVKKKKKAKKTQPNPNAPDKSHDKGNNEGPSTNNANHFKNISQDKEVARLVQDLVNCFINSNKMDKKESEIINKQLCEKTTKVVVHVLNTCVDKMCQRLNKSDIQEFQGLVNKKDASCQVNLV